MQQKEAFLVAEGNAWHKRNDSPAAESPARLRQVAVLSEHINPTARVLEIGCSSGHLSHQLRQRLTGGESFGLDPSKKAIEKGRIAYPELSLSTGTADSLPYKDGFFGAVWFAFCLYLVDRPLLHRVVAEADRVLSAGGILAITDFDPPHPSKRPYRHRDGLLCS